jgi:hypothetical protein
MNPTEFQALRRLEDEADDIEVALRIPSVLEADHVARIAGLEVRPATCAVIHSAMLLQRAALVREIARLPSNAPAPTDDQYLPDYKPKAGERIFVDVTPESARKYAIERADHYWDDPGYQKYLTEYSTKDEFVASLTADMLQPGGPDIVEVGAEPGPESESSSRFAQECHQRDRVEPLL